LESSMGFPDKGEGVGGDVGEGPGWPQMLRTLLPNETHYAVKILYAQPVF